MPKPFYGCAVPPLAPILGQILVPAATLLLVLAFGVLSARSGASGRLAERPLAALMIGLGLGMVLQLTALPTPPPETLREAARLGLAVLAFTAAQQCRPSRLAAVSPPALRLVLIAMPLVVAGVTAAVFALLPGVGLGAAAVIGGGFALGGGVFAERAAMSAPLGDEVKRTVRLDTAAGLAFGVPLALLIEAAVTPPVPGAPLWAYTGFGLFAGAAVGGAIGLLAARRLPVRDAAVPAAPLIALGAAFIACRLLGFDAVMGSVACGLLYSQEASLLGPVRSRVVGAGLRWVAPLGLLGAGAALGPLLFGANVLMLVAAGVALLALVPLARGAALGATALPEAARSFLSRFGGVPGAGAALFYLSLLASPALGAAPEALTFGAACLFGGVILGGLSAGPLVTRQVRAAARARRRRYAA